MVEWEGVASGQWEVQASAQQAQKRNANKTTETRLIANGCCYVVAVAAVVVAVVVVVVAVAVAVAVAVLFVYCSCS